MFVLSPDNKPQDIFLFTSESYAVEALIEGGKEFFLSYSKLIDLVTCPKQIDLKPFIHEYYSFYDLEGVRTNNENGIYSSLLKSFQTELESIQSIEKFNNFSRSLRESKLMAHFLCIVRPEKLTSVFYGEKPHCYDTIKWTLKEYEENQLFHSHFTNKI